MAEKKEIKSTVVASAYSRVKEQKFSDWGAAQHGALLRYVAVDAMKSALSMVERNAKLPEDKRDKEMTAERAMLRLLKQAFEDDTEIVYASNFKKLVVKMGDLQENGGYV